MNVHHAGKDNDDRSDQVMKAKTQIGKGMTSIGRPKRISFAIALVLSSTGAQADNVFWMGGSDDWSDPLKWSSNPLLPGATDNVFINVSGAQTITHSVGSDTIFSLSMGGDETLALTGGVLNITSVATLNTFVQSVGSTLSGAGAVFIHGNATLAGLQSGPTVTALSGGGQINGNFSLDNGRVLNNAAGSALNWTAGFINLDAISAGLSGTMTNSGLFVADGDGANLLSTSGGGSFQNHPGGIFRKSGSSAGHVTNIFSVFQNDGLVDVQTGTLNLANHATHNGDFNVAAGATLQFGAGTHNLAATSAINGAGTLRVTNATLSSNGTVAVSDFEQTGGAFVATGNQDFTNFTQSNGLFTSSGTTVIAGNAVLSGGTQSGPGTTRLLNQTTIDGSISIDGHTLENALSGTLTWSGGSINVDPSNGAGGGTFQNNGLFVATGDAVDIVFNSFAGGTFNNAGTFRKTGSSANDLTDIVADFNNTGIVDIQTGTLRLGNDGEHTGDFVIASNSTLHFFGGFHTLGADSTIGGPGTLRISDGGVSVSGGAVQVGNYIQSGGSFVSSGNVQATDFTQSAGSVFGSGSITVTRAAALSGGFHSSTGITRLQGMSAISGNLGFDGGRIVENADVGIVDWTAGNIDLDSSILVGSGTLRNDGLFVAAGDTAGNIISSSGGGLVNNTATAILRKSGSTAAHVADIGTAFQNAGTVDVQTGVLSVSSSGFDNQGVVRTGTGATFRDTAGFTNSGTLEGGGIVDAGDTLATALLNNGQINPGVDSRGHLTVDGFLTLGSGSNVNLELESAVLFDTLSIINGDVALGGTLNILGTGYNPTVGDSFTLMNFANRNGTVFDNVLFNVNPLVSFATLYGANDLTLQITATPINWVSTTGFWDAATNWSSNPSLPGATDNVFIDVAGTSSTITHRNGIDTINRMLMTGDETLAITGGTLNIEGATTLNALNQSNGILGGAGDVTVTGATALTGGTQTGNGVTHLQGASTLAGNYFVDGGRTLHNAASGTLMYTAGLFDLNRADAGVGTLQNDGLIVASGNSANMLTANTSSGGVFNNAGTLRKINSTAAHVTFLNTAFNNTGTVDVQTGILALNAGGSHTGSFAVAPGATLHFGNGTHTLDAASSINGAGAKLVVAGTVNANGAIAVENLTLTGQFNTGNSYSFTNFTHTGGRLNSTGDVTVTDTSTLGNATQTGAGTTRLQGASRLEGNYIVDGGRTLHNTATGELTYTAGFFDLNRADAGVGMLQNDGLIVASGSSANLLAANTSSGGVFNNAGTLRKVGSTAAHVTHVNTAFNNTGTVDVQTGILSANNANFVNDGVIDVAAGARFRNTSGTFTNNGRLTGNGAFDPATAITNAGIIDPGTGIGSLTVEGGLTQTSTGLFDIELGALSSFDTLNVLGNVALDGTLRISSLGSYNPIVGDSFTIMTFDDGQADASDLAGIFSNFIWTGFNPSVAFTAAYFDHSIVVTAGVNAVPVPAAAWLFGSGLVGLVAVARRKQTRG